ncbi:hypothetical protein ACQEVX_08045 [Streptomyces syringium]|uniref:hypothetical protein n=1 Tax=Streptomyces syringium TaxID=76729 RepID=UPI003D8AA369
MPACFSYPAPHPADSPAAPAIRCRAARTARAPSGPPGCSPHTNDVPVAPISPRRFSCRSALGAGAGP